MTRILDIPKTMAKIKTATPKRTRDKLRKFNDQVWKGWKSISTNRIG